MLRKLFEHSEKLGKLGKLSELRRHDHCYSFSYIGFNEGSALACCYLGTSSPSRGIVVTREPRAQVATDRAYG